MYAIGLQALQCAAEPLPATTGGGNAQPLLRRVYANHLRTDADHIQIGVLLEEQTALQTGVNSQHFGFGVEEVFVCLLGHFHQR